jgi:hypothetical protein
MKRIVSVNLMEILNGAETNGFSPAYFRQGKGYLGKLVFNNPIGNESEKRAVIEWGWKNKQEQHNLNVFPAREAIEKGEYSLYLSSEETLFEGIGLTDRKVKVGELAKLPDSTQIFEVKIIGENLKKVLRNAEKIGYFPGPIYQIINSGCNANLLLSHKETNAEARVTSEYRGGCSNSLFVLYTPFMLYTPSNFKTGRKVHICKE